MSPALDADVCYRAIQTRDRRFDGLFFTGVRSTGIFCRPVCPASVPKRENCTFIAVLLRPNGRGIALAYAVVLRLPRSFGLPPMGRATPGLTVLGSN